MENGRHRLVVGVDYGTTYSGVAYLHTSKPYHTDIEVIQNWPGAGGGGGLDNRTLDKAPTEISYGGRGDIWGYQLSAGTKRYGYFKLLLDAKAEPTKYDDPDLGSVIDAGNPNALLELPPGKSALDVTADYLKLLYDHIISQLEKRLITLESTPIQFVLTTPAIWSHEAQAATCEAAKRAGFASRPGDTISMISEPEAAASYCLRDVQSKREGSDSPLQVGERIVICDAGGGTVDLVTYTISQTTPRLLVKEAVVGNGGKCGSTAIDRAFLKFLASRIGGSFKRWSPKKTGRGGLLMMAFERAKRSFGTSSEDQSWRIPLGFVEDNVRNGIEDGELKLTSKHMAEIFDPVVNQVIMLISQQVADANGADPKKVSTILLVGGFGESQYLYKKVKEWAQAQPHPIAVVNPEGSWSAVAKGAVIDGMESIVQSRKLTQHYGVRLSTLFVEGVHDEEDAYIDHFDGVKLTKDHIVWFARRGEEIEAGRRIPIPYSANFRGGKKVRKLAIKGCKFEEAPSSAKHWKVNDEGTVVYDLSSVPDSAFQHFELGGKPRRKSSTKSKKVLRGYFTVDMIMGSADLRFECMYQGECCGETEISY